MNPRPTGRSSPCTRAQATVRLEHAEKFLEVAELVAGEADAIPASASVSAALAILAGIAASDATCCSRLGQRARGQDHRQALPLLAQVAGSDNAVKSLGRLLDVKDTAHYGVIHLGAADLKSVLRAARTIVEFAQAALR